MTVRESHYFDTGVSQQSVPPPAHSA